MNAIDDCFCLLLWTQLKKIPGNSLEERVPVGTILFPKRDKFQYIERFPVGKIPFSSMGIIPLERVPAGKIPFLTVGRFPWGDFLSKLRVKFLWGQFHPKLRGKFLLSKFLLVKLTVGENSVYKIFVGKSPSTLCYA